MPPEVVARASGESATNNGAPSARAAHERCPSGARASPGWRPSGAQAALKQRPSQRIATTGALVHGDAGLSSKSELHATSSGPMSPPLGLRTHVSRGSSTHTTGTLRRKVCFSADTAVRIAAVGLGPNGPGITCRAPCVSQARKGESGSKASLQGLLPPRCRSGRGDRLHARAAQGCRDANPGGEPATRNGDAMCELRVPRQR